MSTTEMPRSDQRRGKRYRQRLPVDLHSQRGAKRLWTHDVGAHGLFLLMNEPPKERHVLKLTIHLPEGPIGAVAHGTHTSPRGMGVQFFALAGEAKRRWDVFIGELSGAPPDEIPPPRATGSDDPQFGEATFVVKLKTLVALRDFAKHCLDAGGTYLRTPVLKAVGSPVTLTMVHPHTERELPLAGVVARLHQKRPKGMEIQFVRSTLAQRAAFEKFLETGEPPPREIDLDAEDGLVVAEEGLAEPAIAAPPADAPDDDVAFDIDVDVIDDSAVERARLSPEEKFDWESVSEDLMIDIGLGDDLDTFAPPETDPNMRFEGRREPLPPSQEGDPIPVEVEDFTRPFLQAVVRCDSCEMIETELDVGTPPGALGLVAEFRPYFCGSCKVVVSVKRLLVDEERREMRQQLMERGGAEAPAPVRLLFEVADLTKKPACPRCAGELKSTKAIKELSRLLEDLEDGLEVDGVTVPCAVCKRGRWSVQRQEPPLKRAVPDDGASAS